MRSYAETNVFDSHDQGELELAIKVIKALPDPNEGEGPWRSWTRPGRAAWATPRPTFRASTSTAT